MKILDGTARFKKRTMGMKRGAILTFFWSPAARAPLLAIDPLDLLKAGRTKEMMPFFDWTITMKTISRIEEMDDVIGDRT